MLDFTQMTKIIYIDEQYNFTEKSGRIIQFEDGISYVKYLRRIEKNVEPIIFTSFYSEEKILERRNTQIITTIGHGFLQLPFNGEKYQEVIDKILPLNEIQLQDIIINFCQLRSSVRESFHIFKGRIRDIKGRNDSLSDKNKLFLTEFENYEKQLLKDVGNYPEIIIEYKAVISKYNPNDLKSIELIEEVQEEQFVTYLPAENDTNVELSSEKKSWKVLFLDDRPSELKSILEILDEKNIEYETAKSCDEAKAIIESDIQSNKISVVVSDYRLFEPQIGINTKPRMQKEQGYDFLLWLNDQPRYNALVALSGLSKWFLMESFRKNRINVKVYSKVGLLGGGAKLFVDDLEYLGNQYSEIVNSQPKAELWNNNQYKDKEKTELKSASLKPYYVFHRNNVDYLTNENKINQDAEKVARELEYAIDKNSDFNFVSLLSIKGNTTSTMKGHLPETEYEDFILKLIQRRVIFYLLLKGFYPYSIYSMLRNGEKLELDFKDDKLINRLKATPNMLAIQAETDIPYGLLMEEKYFLQHHMNLPIYNIAEMMDQTYSIINSVLTKHLKGNKNIAETLKNYCCEKENQISFGTVSMAEVHIVIPKVVSLLIKENKIEVAKLLLEDILGVLYGISDLVPTNEKIKNSIKIMETLTDKISLTLSK